MRFVNNQYECTVLAVGKAAAEEEEEEEGRRGRRDLL